MLTSSLSIVNGYTWAAAERILCLPHGKLITSIFFQLFRANTVQRDVIHCGACHVLTWLMTSWSRLLGCIWVQQISARNRFDSRKLTSISMPVNTRRSGLLEPDYEPTSNQISLRSIAGKYVWLGALSPQTTSRKRQQAPNFANAERLVVARISNKFSHTHQFSDCHLALYLINKSTPTMSPSHSAPFLKQPTFFYLMNNCL